MDICDVFHSTLSAACISRSAAAVSANKIAALTIAVLDPEWYVAQKAAAAEYTTTYHN